MEINQTSGFMIMDAAQDYMLSASQAISSNVESIVFASKTLLCAWGLSKAVEVERRFQLSLTFTTVTCSPLLEELGWIKNPSPGVDAIIKRQFYQAEDGEEELMIRI